MKAVRLLKTIVVVGVISATLCLFAGCNGSSSGVAATVNGQEIPEEKVTSQIEHIRAQSGLTDTDQWGKFLVQQDMTPESVRETVINTMTDTMLIKEGAADLEIAVEDSDVDDAINSFKENYESDENWQDALKQAGFTEDTYRETIRDSMYEQKVGDYFDSQIGEDGVTDEDRIESAKTYVSYYDDAKRTSHILFKVEDKNDEEAMAAAYAQAEDVLAQINAGMDFAEAARQYSQDEGSAENGGDVGWDKLNSFVQEYTDAVTNLELNQVSDPVESEYGYHIIKVTEVFDAPEADALTSMDQIPEAFRENINSMAESVQADDLYKEWLDELKENAEIEINPMPKGLPYDIDLTPYEEEQAAQEAENASAEGTTDDTGAVEGDVTTDTESGSLEGTADLTDDVLADEGITDPNEEAAIVDSNVEEAETDAPRN